MPKSQRKEVYFYAPKHKGKHGKDHDKKEKPKVLKYDVGTLTYFEQCGVSFLVWVSDLLPVEWGESFAHGVFFGVFAW